MIFIYNTVRVLYWENNQVIHEHVPVDYRDLLLQLYVHPRNIDGQLPQTTESMYLIYSAVKDMAAQTGLSHRYSPEFIFAHEFTEHYDEFAQYLPEFGRLKELSKMTVLIRYLNNIHQSNHEALEAIDCLLANSKTSPAPNTPSYTEYHRVHEAQYKQVINLFADLRNKLRPAVQVSQWEQKLSKIKNDIKYFNKEQQSKQMGFVAKRFSY
jgi:hypothetical protein